MSQHQPPWYGGTTYCSWQSWAGCFASVGCCRDCQRKRRSVYRVSVAYLVSRRLRREEDAGEVGRDLPSPLVHRLLRGKRSLDLRIATGRVALLGGTIDDEDRLGALEREMMRDKLKRKSESKRRRTRGRRNLEIDGRRSTARSWTTAGYRGKSPRASARCCRSQLMLTSIEGRACAAGRGVFSVVVFSSHEAPRALISSGSFSGSLPA